MKRHLEIPQGATPTRYETVRLLLVAGAVLLLCSCRAFPGASPREGDSPLLAGRRPGPGQNNQRVDRGTASLTRQESEREHGSPVQPAAYQEEAPAGIISQLDGPYAEVGMGRECEPAGVACGCEAPEFWPDEWLCDGGDKDVSVAIDADWTVRGLDTEDTVAHYDTLEGRTEVAPSNQICIYAPRFASVRKVFGVAMSEQVHRPVGARRHTAPELETEIQLAANINQPLQPTPYVGVKSPVTFRDTPRGLNVDNVQPTEMATGALRPYENFRLIRQGVFLESEKVRLATRVAAAKVWQVNDGVQIMIENIRATEAHGESSPGETVLYEVKGKGLVRLCKVASKQNALPGDEVEFTIRFDNVGVHPVGNVTVIDNLTTRLEYIEGSQSCDQRAEFFTINNAGNSLILRWEIAEPLKAGEGGLIRFKCCVR